MESPRKIDRSFKERQGVLHLLEKLKKENITFAEMDEIGSLIHKAGRSAVRPLLRHISREKSGSLISKYTYLLEFLDDSYWLEQIIHIALKRRDLEVEGKSAILATLEDCGIDVTLPPFSTLLASVSQSAPELFNRLINQGEEGLVALLEEFACLPGEVKRSFLSELARLSDQRTVEFFAMLLWFDNPDVVKDVITALGRVRFESAATALQRFRLHAEPALQNVVDQSLKRLSFMGICSQSATPVTSYQPFHSAYCGPVDGNGFRNLLIARWREDGSIDSIDLQLHDINGLEDVSGGTAEPLEEFEERVAERVGQEIIEPVAPDFAVELLRDALLKNQQENYPLPPEFMLRRRMFSTEEIRPSAYTPPLSTSLFKATPALLALSTTLFEDEFFAGWAIESCQVYDSAEEWLRLEKTSSKKQLGSALELLIEKLCRDEFQPQLRDISRRLVLNADYLARTGMDAELVHAALAAAESIRDFSLPCHLHPFLRRFAMESLIVAREALEEGYDYRDYHEEWDD
jgi:hypothetical protein